MVTRIKELINYYGISTRAFAMKIGLNQPTLDRMLKGINALNLNCIVSILAKCPEVSSEWLIRGTGDMLLREAPRSQELQRIDKLIDTIATLQDTINTKSEIIATLTEQIKKLENKK